MASGLWLFHSFGATPRTRLQVIKLVSALPATLLFSLAPKVRLRRVYKPYTLETPMRTYLDFVISI